MTFLHIFMAQIVEILPQVRQGPTYSTYSIVVADVLEALCRQGINNHDIDLVKPRELCPPM